jgi:hypothetical protein
MKLNDKAPSRAGNPRRMTTCAREGCTAGRFERWMRRRESVYLNDRWYCGEDCAQAALLGLLALPPRAAIETKPSIHRLPLGLLLLSRGVIDETQLKAALTVQGQTPEMKIGQCLERLGAVTGEDITRALGAQHSLPVLLALQPEPDGGIPLALLETSRCVAYRGNYQPGVVYIGFEGAVDRALVNAAETVLSAQCEPCIVDARTIEEHLASRRQFRNPDEILFETKTSGTEIVRSVQSYVQQARADVVRVAATRQYLWVKLRGARQLDLLFRTA